MTRTPFLLLAALLVIGALVGCGSSKAPAPQAPAPAAQAAERVRLEVEGAPVLRVELADDSLEHSQGLMGREALASDGGMLFVFGDAAERRFWMKGTLIALDVLWIRDGRVIGVDTMRPEPGVPDARLRRYPSPGPADEALEVNAGWAARHRVEPGARVERIDG